MASFRGHSTIVIENRPSGCAKRSQFPISVPWEDTMGHI